MVRIVVFLVGFAVFSTCINAAEPVAPFLNTDQLGKQLKQLGYEPVAATPEIQQITLDQNGWKVHVLVCLSKDGERVWLESKFTPIADPDRVPAQTLLRLLEANDKIAPAYFAYVKTDQRIHIYKCFDNSNVTAKRLQAEIVAFDKIIRETHALWRPDVFDDNREILQVAPRIVATSAEELTRFQGVWQIVRIELRGKIVTEAQLAESIPTLTIVDDKACLRSSADQERNVKLRFDPSSSPSQIDFVDEKGRTEKGIYKQDGETVIFCFAGAGGQRPIVFAADAELGNWLMVLRKKR